MRLLQSFEKLAYIAVSLTMLFSLMFIMVVASGCGDSSSSAQNDKNVKEEPTTETKAEGAKCPACVAAEEDEADNKAGNIFEGDTEITDDNKTVIKGRVIVSPIIDEESQTEDESVTHEIVKHEAIQLSPDPAIVETIVGKKPNLDFDFINQKGNKKNISKDYPGKVLVITSMYTSCPKAEMCPRLTSDMAWLARQIPDELRDSIQLILVSFDPVQDIPPVLKAFGTARGVDFEVTDMLTGDIHDVRQLLEFELEVPIDLEPYTNVITAHAMMVHVINADGYIVAERTANVTQSIELIAKEMVRAVEIPFVPQPVENVNTSEPVNEGAEG